MCGIVGFIDRTGKANVVDVLFQMMKPLKRRGPDAAGAAVFYGPPAYPVWKAIILLTGSDLERDEAILRQGMDDIASVKFFQRKGVYVTVELNEAPDLDVLGKTVEEELLSGRASIVYVGTMGGVWKTSGSVEGLENFFAASAGAVFGIGHTRMATESREALRNAQPFAAKRWPDLAIVHNGHITNHLAWKRKLEQKGYTFTAESDSEIIPAFLAECLRQGATMEEALHEAGNAFDGSYTILAADNQSVGFVRDRFATKPLVIAETDDFVAIANETTAVVPLLRGSASVYEPSAGEVRVWSGLIAV